MATSPERIPEPKMDPDALYLEEVFTDRKIGTLRRMTPVTRTGATDASRAILYIGETQVMTAVGTLPIVFEIDAESLGDAAAKFGALAKAAIERTVKELQDLRRQAASSLVIPQGGMPDLGGGGLGGLGGGGRGGKIQLP
ncbi:MAG: hypothetical protein WCA12_13600 [Burkholderiales bacterium]